MTPVHGIRVLLVDDQRLVGEAVRRMLAPETDIAFEFCQDGTQALAAAAAAQPTVILQDLVMPGVDGLTLVERFRAEPTTRDVPLIVLSSKEEPTVKADAFERGASDYLVKLPDRIELVARIRHHSRGYIALLERNEAFQALAAELAEAAGYVRSILPAPLVGAAAVDWEFQPSTSLGGDGFGYHDLDADHFVAYLLDVCGHGVGAALLSVSAMNTLNGRTLPGVAFDDPAAVLAGLNAAFPMERHHNMWFTMWYGVLHRPSRRLRYASAGHPPAIVVGPDGRARRLQTSALPIGADDLTRFTAAEADVEPGARLYLFSDGAYEIARPAGGMMTLDDLEALLVAPSGGRKLEAVRRALERAGGRPDFEDDMSIVELLLP
jgi:sigma-B regulation protein RsbU (phosphoserine phosphatase)